MKKLLPFSSGASAHGFRHTLLGWHRRLTNQKQERFVEAMVARGLQVESLRTGEIRFRTCPLCGYAIASVTNVSGWNIQGCSAIILPKMIESSGFNPWFNQVADSIQGWKQASASGAESVKETNLQPSGH